MLFERFPHHFRGQAGLHVLEALDGVVTILYLRLVLVLERLLCEFLLEFGFLQTIPQLVPLLHNGVYCLGYRKFLRDLSGIEPSLQFLNLGILDGTCLLHFTYRSFLGQFNGASLLLLRQFKAFMQLLLEFTVSHLLEDVRISGFIHLEGLVAMWANDIVHVLEYSFKEEIITNQ